MTVLLLSACTSFTGSAVPDERAREYLPTSFQAEPSIPMSTQGLKDLQDAALGVFPDAAITTHIPLNEVLDNLDLMPTRAISIRVEGAAASHPSSNILIRYQVVDGVVSVIDGSCNSAPEPTSDPRLSPVLSVCLSGPLGHGSEIVDKNIETWTDDYVQVTDGGILWVFDRVDGQYTSISFRPDPATLPSPISKRSSEPAAGSSGSS